MQDDQPAEPLPRTPRPRLFDNAGVWALCIGVAIVCFGMATAMLTVSWKASFRPLLAFLVIPFGVAALAYPAFDYRQRTKFYLAMNPPDEGPAGELLE